MRRTYVWDRASGKFVEKPKQAPLNEGPCVFGDFEGYVSPASGKWIEGRRARRDDLARTHCRPFEGLEAERKMAQQVERERQAKSDAAIERAAARAWNDLSTASRRVLEKYR
jgi:hypothetical protein